MELLLTRFCRLGLPSVVCELLPGLVSIQAVGHILSMYLQMFESFTPLLKSYYDDLRNRVACYLELIKGWNSLRLYFKDRGEI